MVPIGFMLENHSGRLLRKVRPRKPLSTRDKIVTNIQNNEIKRHRRITTENTRKAATGTVAPDAHENQTNRTEGHRKFLEEIERQDAEPPSTPEKANNISLSRKKPSRNLPRTPDGGADLPKPTFRGFDEHLPVVGPVEQPTRALNTFSSLDVDRGSPDEVEGPLERRRNSAWFDRAEPLPGEHWYITSLAGPSTQTT